MLSPKYNTVLKTIFFKTQTAVSGSKTAVSGLRKNETKFKFLNRRNTNQKFIFSTIDTNLPMFLLERPHTDHESAPRPQHSAEFPDRLAPASRGCQVMNDTYGDDRVKDIISVGQTEIVTRQYLVAGATPGDLYQLGTYVRTYCECTGVYSEIFTISTAWRLEMVHKSLTRGICKNDVNPYAEFKNIFFFKFFF